MELRRFFVDSSQIDGDNVTVVGDEYLHLAKVLRFKVGYRCIICCNDGLERLAEVTSIDREVATLKTLECNRVDSKGISLTLYAGLLKNNKLDFAIQKAVELGVDRVVPFLSKNCAETKFQVDRANRIALEAAKQCGSAYLSVVGELIDFDRLEREISRYDSVIFAYEKERDASIRSISESILTSGGKNIALIIGPEGGFTDFEADRLVLSGATRASLGKRILRAETASIVACALLLDSLGELDASKDPLQ